MKKIYITKVQKNMFLLLTLTAVLPMLFIGVFTLTQMGGEIRTKNRQQIRAEVQRVNSILFDLTLSTYTASDAAFPTNMAMQLFAAGENDGQVVQETQSINQFIGNFYNSTASVSSVEVYTNNQNIPEMTYIHYLADYDGRNWYQALNGQYAAWEYLPRQQEDVLIAESSQETSSSDASSQDLPEKDYEEEGRKETKKADNTERELCLIRRIAVPSQTYSAYMVIRLDNNYLQNVLGTSSYEDDVFVKGQLFYTSNFENRSGGLSFAEAAGGEDPTDGVAGATDTGASETYAADTNDGKQQERAALQINETHRSLSAIHSFSPYRTDSVLTIVVRDFDGPLQLRSIYRGYLLMLVIALAVPVLIVGLFSRSFSRRVETLRDSMRQVRDGDYEINTQVAGDDELTETFQDLKMTVQQIVLRQKEFYDAKLHEQELANEQQQMEFKMLASQINPHFLYNTLEMIRMQALSGGNRDVAYSIKLLGRTMHYVLENTGATLTTLDKELDYVQAYLEIQKLRFGDRLNYEIHVAGDVQPKECRVLPLTIQPIVENAVVHGLQDVEEGGMIRIEITREPEDKTEPEVSGTKPEASGIEPESSTYAESVNADISGKDIRTADAVKTTQEPHTASLVFCIADNGPGMDQQELEAVRRNIIKHDKENTRSIGLYNINKRIRLLYGRNASISVDSLPGKGTVVTLVIPASFQALKA